MSAQIYLLFWPLLEALKWKKLVKLDYTLVTNLCCLVLLIRFFFGSCASCWNCCISWWQIQCVQRESPWESRVHHLMQKQLGLHKTMLCKHLNSKGEPESLLFSSNRVQLCRHRHVINDVQIAFVIIQCSSFRIASHFGVSSFSYEVAGKTDCQCILLIWHQEQMPFWFKLSTIAATDVQKSHTGSLITFMPERRSYMSKIFSVR